MIQPHTMKPLGRELGRELGTARAMFERYHAKGIEVAVQAMDRVFATEGAIEPGAFIARVEAIAREEHTALDDAELAAQDSHATMPPSSYRIKGD